MTATRSVSRTRWVAASLLFGACTIPNPNATSSSGTTTSGTGASTGKATSAASTSTGVSDMAPPPCEPSGTCIPDAPPDWQGPVVVLEGSPLDPPACDMPWPMEILRANAGLTAPDPVCDCACEAPEGGTCGDVTLKRHDSSCLAVPTLQVSLAPDSCDDNGGAGFPAGGKWHAEPSEYVGGGCAPIPTEDVPEATWDTEHVICTADALQGTCEPSATCRPAPPADAVVCIHKDGDLPCPQRSPYTNRQVVFGGMDDGRRCTECSCGDPEGTCASEVRFVQNSCIGGVLVGSHAVDGSCFDGPMLTFDYLALSSATPNATCAPTPSIPEGEALPKEPVTLCCM